MILQTLAWKLQKWQGSSPSPFSYSTFLFFLLPSAAATYSASTSASFPKEQDNVIVCSQLFMSPHCYRTNFLNCHLGHSLLCQPISSDPLPSPLVLPSKLQVYYPSHWIQFAFSLFWGKCLCSHWGLRTGVYAHNISTHWNPTCSQSSAHTHLNGQYSPSHCQVPWKWNDPSEHSALHTIHSQ